MAVTALHTAATGLSALATDIDIIANNLANTNTVGFKGMRANFQDLIYQEKEQPGVENANGDVRPAGLYVGLGTRISNTQTDFSTGSPIPTEKDLDMMIVGPGFFKVSILQEEGDGFGYTRAGNFFRNRDGELVLGNLDGPRLEQGITIPTDAVRVDIAKDGTVNAFVPGQVEPSVVGQIQISTFVNPAGLKAVGGNLYVETAGSGPPIEGAPGEGQLGTIHDKHLESSNVDPVKELVKLIKTQRSFEMNSQSIEAADEALQVIANLRRF